MLILLFLLLNLSTCLQLLHHHTLKLQGNISLGYYYAPISIGTPPQPQSLIVDTGSGLFAVPCVGCQNCGSSHLHKPFQANLSSSSSYVLCNTGQQPWGTQSKVCANCQPGIEGRICEFQVFYAEGSLLKGVVARDYVAVDRQEERVKVMFGCTLTETNMFIEQKADGVLGLAPSRDHDLLEKIYKEHTKFSHQTLSFGLCLAENGGKMIIGNVDQPLLGEHYTQIGYYISPNNLYSLNAKSIIYGADFKLDISLQQLGSMRMFIDSGATYSYLPKMHYKKLEHAITQLADSLKLVYVHLKDTLCLILSKEVEDVNKVLDLFPNITYEMEGGIRFDWIPRAYWLQDENNKQRYCLGMEPYDRFLLGTSWMINRYIHFDLQSKTLKINNNADCLGLRRKQKQQVSALTKQEQPKQSQKQPSNKMEVVEIKEQLVAIGAQKDDELKGQNKHIKILILLGTIVLLSCFSCPFLIEYNRHHRDQTRVINGYEYTTTTQQFNEQKQQGVAHNPISFS